MLFQSPAASKSRRRASRGLRPNAANLPSTAHKTNHPSSPVENYSYRIEIYSREPCTHLSWISAQQDSSSKFSHKALTGFARPTAGSTKLLCDTSRCRRSASDRLLWISGFEGGSSPILNAVRAISGRPERPLQDEDSSVIVVGPSPCHIPGSKPWPKPPRHACRIPPAHRRGPRLECACRSASKVMSALH